jgi:DNA uptake protein ComE-like DNA-binding protein
LRQQRGFVLATTLWVLAILTVAAAYFAERMQHARQLAEQAQLRTQALVDMAGTRAEILFRLATTPISLYGLGASAQDAIALDDRAYGGLGDTLVRLQDNRGLINLNFARDDQLERFLNVLGVPAARRAAMIDTLRDYVDEDDLKHLNGAEAADYAAAGLPPPRNAKLITPFEAKNIYGWKEVAPLWQDNLLARLTTTSGSYSVNPNTAPWQVLATISGMTPEAAQAIVRARSAAPIVHAGQVQSLTGIAISTDPFTPDVITLPADSVRLTQQARGMEWGWQYNFTLTPMSDAAPWRIDYFYRLALPSKDSGNQVTIPLPARAALPESFLPVP